MSIYIYMITCLLALPPKWSRPPSRSPAVPSLPPVGVALPSVGVLGVGWDEETRPEVFPSFLWMWVGAVSQIEDELHRPFVSLQGMGMRGDTVSKRLNRSIYRYVDTEMDYHSYAAYAVFLRFSES